MTRTSKTDVENAIKQAGNAFPTRGDFYIAVGDELGITARTVEHLFKKYGLTATHIPSAQKEWRKRKDVTEDMMRRRGPNKKKGERPHGNGSGNTG